MMDPRQQIAMAMALRDMQGDPWAGQAQSGGGGASTADVVAAMPQRMPERAMRRLTQKRMAGVDLDPGETQALGRHEAYQEQVGEPTAMELTGIPAFGRSARTAWHEPTIENVADAGARGAMLIARPAAALGMLGAGYASALARDIGGIGSASAAEADGLTDAQRTRLQALEQKQAKGFKNGSERRDTEGEIGRLRDLQARFQADRNATQVAADRAKGEADQATYNRDVATAERIRDEIRATNTSFRDTNVGKFYEKTGGTTPVAAGVVGGMIGRMAHGGGTAMKNYVVPAAEGAGATFATMQAPLFFDAYSTPTLNPERRALEAYSRELPSAHPRKQEFADMAAGMDKLNPVQQAARDDLTSVSGTLRRMGVAAVEGGLAGVTGAAAPLAVRRGIEGIAEIPGSLAAGYQRGMARSTAAKDVSQTVQRVAGQETRVAGQEAQTVRSAEQAIAEVRRRKGQQTADPASPQAASAAGRQPSPESSPNPSAPPSSGAIVPVDAAAGQQMTTNVPAPGKWAAAIAPTARQVLLDRAARGVPMWPGQAAAIHREISAALPPGVSTSYSDVKSRVGNLYGQMQSEAPSKKALQSVFRDSPGSIRNDQKVFGLGLPAALVAAMATPRERDPAVDEIISGIEARMGQR